MDAGLGPIARGQAPAHVIQADAGPFLRYAIRIDVVLDPYPQQRTGARRVDADRTRFDHLPDAVLDRVLDQRLQQHRRQQAGASLLADLGHEAQARPEATL